MSTPLLIAKNTHLEVVCLLPTMANRHGLIAGATGTGKTVTLQKMTESFSNIGVPVFMADVKGDLAGLAKTGTLSEKLEQRLQKIGINDWCAQENPVQLWDIFGERGHPVRATVSDLGPLLLSRLLDLNDTQSGVLHLVFKIADNNGLLLLDFKDLQTMLRYVGDNAKTFQTQYGNISAASIGAIQRGLLVLSEQGAEHFFGEPMLDIYDLIKTNSKGKGVINILASEKLYQHPKLYATYLLWVLSELFEHLPEIGDVEQPRLVFFFDEAHLLFNGAPKVLLEKIEQVVRLTRSKGIGVYFVSQNPMDIPEAILGQLGNRVQHAMRTFTPKDQKAVKATAQTMRPNPDFDTEQAITELAIGEALISFLDEKGSPSIVQKAFVIAPSSRMGAIANEERNALINQSMLYGRYEKEMDRTSAYETLQQQESTASPEQQEQERVSTTAAQNEAAKQNTGIWGSINEVLFGSTGPRGGKKDGLVQTATKTVTRQLTNQIVRGVLGSILGGRKS